MLNLVLRDVGASNFERINFVERTRKKSKLLNVILNFKSSIIKN